MTACWYVARCRPQREAHAVHELLDLGFKAFHPTYTKRVGKGATRRIVERPILPGYCFVEFDRLGQGWERCWAAKSIFGILGQGSTPLAVPMEAIIRYIDQATTDESDLARILAPETVIDVGDTVRIATLAGNHPFEGHIVPVLALDRSGNLAVEFELFGGKAFASLIPRAVAVKSVAA